MSVGGVGVDRQVVAECWRDAYCVHVDMEGNPVAQTEQTFPCIVCKRDMGYHGYLMAINGVCGSCSKVRPVAREDSK